MSHHFSLLLFSVDYNLFKSEGEIFELDSDGHILSVFMVHFVLTILEYS